MATINRFKISSGRLLWGLALAGLAGCGQKNAFVEPPPPEVTVMQPKVEDVTTYLEYPGHTEGFESVEIRARIAGFLKEIEFKPGAYVNQGDLLFVIEQEPFQAAVASAKAALASAEANLDISETELKRKSQAAERNAVAEVEVERARADRDVARAAVEGARAAVNDAEIRLSYTEVRTPLSGRVSRELVDLGNLVGSGDATLLTTVVRDNPIFVNFEVNEREVLPYLSQRPTETREEIERSKEGQSLRLRLSNGEVYDQQGEINFMDNRVDPNTGTIGVRAVFPNDGNKLAAGLFVRVMIPQPVEGAILIPRMAIQRDLAGDFVLVVDAEDVVRRRNVTPAANVDDLRIIEKGLDPGELVIVAGLQRAREGIEVTPVAAERDGGASAEAPPQKQSVEGGVPGAGPEDASGASGKANEKPKD